MLVVALLVAGLACLCVGLLLSSSAWLIASLACSVVAGLLIYRNRDSFAIARGSRRSGRSGRSGRPGSSTGKHAASASTASIASAAPAARPDPDVWVVDGRPRYHRANCEIIQAQHPEAIPLSQADEDGFIPCSLCQPERVDAAS